MAKERTMITTVGKIIFNEIMPPEFPYLNEPTDFQQQSKHRINILLEAGTDIPAHIKRAKLVLPFKGKLRKYHRRSLQTFQSNKKLQDA